MCGIAGIVDTRNGLSIDEIACRDRMVTALAHRGPDGRGRHDRGPGALGHARLSIIGLESGPSPCSVVGVANGEVYNNDEHATGHRNHTGRIYTLVVFELWHRCHRPRRARSAAGICDATL